MIPLIPIRVEEASGGITFICSKFVSDDKISEELKKDLLNFQFLEINPKIPTIKMKYEINFDENDIFSITKKAIEL